MEQGIEVNNARTAFDSNADKLKLTIATLYIPPYATSSFDVKIVYEDSRRFTMNDIAKIKKDTIKLTRTVRIHSVEIANLKNPVLNNDGTNLLKTGILVETFNDFSKADLTNQDFLCAFDFRQGTCNPLFTATDMPLQIVSATNYSINDGIITARYSEEIFTSQLEANHFVNPNPGGINNGRGRSKLGKKSSFAVNLLIWAAIAFAALATALYFGATIAGITIFNATISVAVAEAYAITSAGASAAVNWIYNLLPPQVWVVIAVLVILDVAGIISVGNELADLEDSVTDAAADFEDSVSDFLGYDSW